MDPEDKEVATRTFLLIKEAYDVLGDDGKRAAYDLYGNEGVEVGRELFQPGMTAEQLQAQILFKKMKKAELSMLRKNVVNGIFSMGLDMTHWFNKSAPRSSSILNSRRTQSLWPRLGNVLVQQNMQITLSRGHDVTLGGVLVAANGNGAAHFEVSYDGHLSEYDDLESHVKIGNQAEIGMSLSRKITDQDTITAGLVHDGEVLSTEVLAERKFTDKTNASVSYTRNEESTVGASVSHRFKKTSGKVSIQSGDDISLGLNMNHQYASDLAFSINSNLSNGRAELEFLFAQKISGRSKLITGFQLSNNGVSIRLLINRLRQKYFLPMTLAKSMALWPIVTAITVPSVLVAGFREFFYKPKMARRRNGEEEEGEDESHSKTTTKAEAESYIRSKAQDAAQNRSQEKASNGLIILLAIYGEIESVDLFAPTIQDHTLLELDTKSGQDVEIPVGLSLANVTDALQLLVRNQKIHVLRSCFFAVPGFYRIGDAQSEKKLHIWYQYQGKRQSIDLLETESLRLPPE
eukprot:TRINITY_DN4940_c0_g1_i2.p1 TRINITY_DN4940_c0_g1~~TRINITY_DN4940_c0_g1_i2.p1  ORF type:complete len:519 (+),score=107.99 TRINITY_DN4940_c0_g1_i2:367-1923(+)